MEFSAKDAVNVRLKRSSEEDCADAEKIGPLIHSLLEEKDVLWKECSADEVLHIVHRVLLHQWEHGQPEIVRNCLALAVKTLSNRQGKKDEEEKHEEHQRNEVEVATLDQLANQSFSLLDSDCCISHGEIHTLLCTLIVLLIQRDQRYLVSFGGKSADDAVSVVSVIERHRRAIESILCEDDGGVSRDISAVSPEDKQRLDNHIANVRDVCVVVHALCESFDNQLSMGSNGVCEELVALLSMDYFVKGNSDNSIEKVVLAVAALAKNAQNRLRLAELGTSALLLHVLENHHECVTTLRRTSEAMRLLASDKIATEKVKLGAAGACPLLSRLLKQHKDNEEMIAEICLLMSVVAEYWRNKIEFSEAGAYETLFVVLKLHKNNADVLAPALRALSAIAVNKDDQFYLKECGVCDLVVELLRLHETHAELVREACGSIWSLALNDDNHVNFLEIGTCELLWKVLKSFNKDIAVLEQLCGAMEALMRHQDLSRWKFVMSGDEKHVLVELIMLNATFPDVLEKICNILKKLSSYEEYRLIFTQETFVFDVLSDCMEFHANNARLCKIMEDLRNKFVVY